MQSWRIVGGILSGILRIMHPDQYRVGYEVLQCLATVSECGDVLATWPTVFHTVSIISNRSSPLHRELKGCFPYFDLLVSVGDYSQAPLELWPLGLQLQNSSGTICGVSGKAFLHGVAEPDGPRFCHALYMRKDLQEFVTVKPCSWMTQSVYSNSIGNHLVRQKLILDEDPFSI